ncbi:MAG TPA: response regulator transcription factor [Gaiellaceae bacterium]|jgi:DNA-binding response OmpR family regulator|nr:response regulator transcription factor [Gaiellaceae bacterium]
MSNALLLAEPEPTLVRHLTSDGFRVVDDGSRPDLALLADDRAVDDVRSRHGDIPVIVLGGPESDAVDRVRALQRGCDDYVAQPFVYEELLARIRAVLRRAAASTHEVRVAGPVRADLATRSVTVDGRAVLLAGKEYELLLMLMTDPVRVFTKEHLLREVWGFRSLGRTRTLDSHASRLRRKLQAVGDGPFVINVWGVGYRLLER